MGSFAEVRIGYDKSTGLQVAIKVMKKNKRDTELMRSVECEMNFISKNIDHQHIVATYDVFDTRDNLFIVMEYMPGGMLYDILANEGYFTEKNAASVMRDLLLAVQCLHHNDIVHRDIKPENVLALNKTWPLKVKLADFGLADFVLENSFGEKSTCGMYGTPFFVAPEVIRAETYTPAVDIWSLGVLSYNMLSGKLPFDGNNIKEVLRRVRSGRYSFPDSEWADISSEAKDFISGLLELDPKKRLTASEALQHVWLTSTSTSERAINNDRSALGYEQRKLRMSSMAIDDVAGLLRLEEEEEGVVSSDDHDGGIRALSRLFPGKGFKSSRSSGSSRSRHTNVDYERRIGMHHGTFDDHGVMELNHGTGVSEEQAFRLGGVIEESGVAMRGRVEDDSAMSEVSIGSYPYNAPGNLPGWNETVSAIVDRGDGISERAESRNRGTTVQNGFDSGGRELGYGGSNSSATMVTDDGFRGGLQFNENFVGKEGDGFALPAILSVRDIMRRRQDAMAGLGTTGQYGGGTRRAGYGPGAKSETNNGHSSDSDDGV